MTNLITGLVGIVLFLAFIGGLAETIGALPFVLIVVIIGAMASYDFYESVRDARQEAASNNTTPAQES